MKATMHILAAVLMVVAFVGLVLAQDPAPDENLPAEENPPAGEVPDSGPLPDEGEVVDPYASQQTTMDDVEEAIQCLARHCFLGEPEVSIESVIAEARGQTLEPEGVEFQLLEHMSMFAVQYAGAATVDLTTDPELVERVRIFLISGIDVAINRPVAYLDLSEYFGDVAEAPVSDEEFLASRWEEHTYLPLSALPLTVSSLGPVRARLGGSHCECPPCEPQEELPAEENTGYQEPVGACILPDSDVQPALGPTGEPLTHLSMASAMVDCEEICKNPGKYPPEVLAFLADRADCFGRALILAGMNLIDASTKAVKYGRFIAGAKGGITAGVKGIGKAGEGAVIEAVGSITKPGIGAAQGVVFGPEAIQQGKMKDPSLWEMLLDPAGTGWGVLQDGLEQVCPTANDFLRHEIPFEKAVMRMEESAPEAKAYFRQNPGAVGGFPLMCSMWCSTKGGWVLRSSIGN